MSILVNLLKFVTLFMTAMNAGGTAYISIVEVPAREEMDTEAAVKSWRSLFPRAMANFKSQGMVMMVLAPLNFLLTRNNFWLPTTAFLVALSPYTIKFMGPVNDELLEQSLDIESDEARQLITQWGERHLMRTYFTVAAFFFAMLACLWPSEQENNN